MFNQKTLSVLFIGKNGPLRKYLVFPSRNSHFSSRNSRTSARSMVYSSLQDYTSGYSLLVLNIYRVCGVLEKNICLLRESRNIRQSNQTHIRKYYYAHQTKQNSTPVVDILSFLKIYSRRWPYYGTIITNNYRLFDRNDLLM